MKKCKHDKTSECGVCGQEFYLIPIEKNKPIYISGAITNSDKIIQKLNVVKFFEVEKELKKLGRPIFNPARTEFEKPEWTEYNQFLAYDLIYIITHKPDMYMMDGWEDSKGALLELEIAKQLCLDITYETPR
jgi:hypothetical protein